MGFMKLHNAEHIAVYDRAYRLRHHAGQVRTDKVSGIGALVGAGVGAVAMKPPIVGGLYGAAFGVGLGVIAHVLTSHKKA